MKQLQVPISRKTKLAKFKFPWRLNLRFWLIVILVLCLLFCIIGPGKVIFNQTFLVQQIQKYQCCTILIFLVLYTIVTILGIPGTVLTIVGGLIFGLSWGTFWSVIGATLGAIGAFWVARYLLHNSIELQFGQHPALSRFQDAVKQQPFQFVLAIRFAPISPFNVVNFLFGLTPIHWLPYSLGTFIGIIPGTLAYTWLGVSGMQAWQGNDQLSFVLAIAFLSLLSILPIIFKKYNA